MKISVSIKWAASIPNPETSGVIVGVFVDDASFTLQSVGLKPYSEKYMLYDAFYYAEAQMQGARIPVATNTDSYTKVYDIKSRRRLGNIEDTLVLQVAPTGSAVATLQGLSWSTSTLLSLGRR